MSRRSSGLYFPAFYLRTTALNDRQTRRPDGPADGSGPNPGAEDRGLLKSSIAGHSIRRDIIERPAQSLK